MCSTVICDIIFCLKQGRKQQFKSKVQKNKPTKQHIRCCLEHTMTYRSTSRLKPQTRQNLLPSFIEASLEHHDVQNCIFSVRISILRHVFEQMSFQRHRLRCSKHVQLQRFSLMLTDALKTPVHQSTKPDVTQRSPNGVFGICCFGGVTCHQVS